MRLIGLFLPPASSSNVKSRQQHTILMETARESLEIRGINYRGMTKNRIIEMALRAPVQAASFLTSKRPADIL